MTRWLVTALVAGLGITSVVLAVRSTDRPEAEFRVLSRPSSGQSDALPALRGTLADLVVPGTARWVGAVAGRKAFVASGTDQRTCFLFTDDFGTGGACMGAESLRDSANYVGEGRGDVVDLLIPVPDAYTDVEVQGRKLKADDNVVLTTVTKEDFTLKIKGAGATLEREVMLAPTR